jgi:anti-sigma factor RsiW
MNDCVNAEIRDQLPDLVHDRLTAAERATVLAHVEGCVDCRDELQLLRDAKTMFARGVPRVDVAYVVGALPKAPAGRAARTGAARSPKRTWSDWRIAAAVTLLIAGGGSYAVMKTRLPAVMIDTAAVVAAGPEGTMLDSSFAAVPDLAAMITPDDDRPAAVGAADVRLGDLDEEQLTALLNDIDNLRAVPASEPEPAGLRIDGTSSLEDM